MATQLYWMDGPWPGKLALAARPRGGDWLEDEVANWRRAGIDTVLSLLTSDEEASLELRHEAEAFRAQGMDFLSLPIPDRQVPSSETEIAATLEKLSAKLSSGGKVVIHCRQGVGRSGLVAACLLITKGFDPRAAVDQVGTARGVSVPETTEQRQWIDHYAAILASPR
ncbi:MAG: dual specificity protein phosphatase family protein [Terriglobales bacterium]